MRVFYGITKKLILSQNKSSTNLMCPTLNADGFLSWSTDSTNFIVQLWSQQILDHHGIDNCSC